MKRILLTSTALAMFSVTAVAADLPVRAAAPAPVMTQYNWSGFYVGAVFAGGLNTVNTWDHNCNYSCSGTLLNSWGVAGGLTAGYNVLVGSAGVIGLEADISAASFKDSWNTPDWESYHRTEMPWFATLRARAGLAFDRTLIYVTGGAAFVNQKTTITYGSGNDPNNLDGTKVGLALGAGVEYALSGNWSVKAEYLGMYVPEQRKQDVEGFYDYERLAARSTTHLARIGLNYRLGGSSTSLPVIASAPYNWSGFYLGAVGAVGVNNSDTKDQWCNFSCSGVALDSWGVAGGLTAGYNFNVGTSGVIGIEADISAASFKDSWNSRDWESYHRTEMPWFATLRARAGLAYGGTLFYVTGGAAFVNQKTRFSDPGETFVNNFSGTEIGLAAGVGAEFALTGAWSVKAEYLAMFVPNDPKNDLNETQQWANLSVQSTTQLFRVGANYRFGGGSAAPGAAPMLANVNWTGFYLGAVAGGGTNSADVKDFTCQYSCSGPALESWGVSGGLTAGYNFQIGRSGLFGIEGDISAASFKESLSASDWRCVYSCATGAFHDTKMSWYATLRARAGLTYGSTLFYATGGLAFVNQETQMFTRDPGYDFIPVVIDGTRTGFALGAGAEFALSHNWSVKGEYLALYAPGRTKQDPNRPNDDYQAFRVNSTTQLMRVGVNYRFGGASAAPVTARY